MYRIIIKYSSFSLDMNRMMIKYSSCSLDMYNMILKIFFMFSRYVQIYLLYLFLHRSYTSRFVGWFMFFLPFALSICPYHLTLAFALSICPYHLALSKNFQCISKYIPMKWGYTIKINKDVLCTFKFNCSSKFHNKTFIG